MSTGLPAERSAWVGIRLLNMPLLSLNECHGNAFHKTNSSGASPSRNKVLQTIVAVGSEKPCGHFVGLLVRRGVMPAKTCFGSTPEIFFPSSKIRSEVM